MFKVQRNSKGFTLIELLIVIAIIGILAAIAIPAYTGYTKKTKFSGIINSMGAIKNAIIAYYTESGSVKGASDYTAIRNTYGIEPATQHASAYAVTTSGADATITATSSISGATGNFTLSTTDMKNWSWSGDSALSAYIPK